MTSQYGHLRRDSTTWQAVAAYIAQVALHVVLLDGQ